MAQTEPGLLKMSLHFVTDALNGNALLRTSVLATVLCITLACIGLSYFGVSYSLDPKDGPNAYSPRLFGLLFLPAEFLIYDLILGNPQPRAALQDLYLDWRFLRLFWALIKTCTAIVAPYLAAVVLLVGLTAGFAKVDKLTWQGGFALITGILVLSCAMLYFLSRFLYLSIVVARRDQKPVRTAFRETKGRLWQIGCALFLPWLAILAVTIPMELLGPVLERRLGFVGLAPWFLMDAALTGFLSCLGAAVFAFSYQRIIGTGAVAEASGAEFALSPAQDRGTGSAG